MLESTILTECEGSRKRSEGCNWNGNVGGTIFENKKHEVCSDGKDVIGIRLDIDQRRNDCNNVGQYDHFRG